MKATVLGRGLQFEVPYCKDLNSALHSFKLEATGIRNLESMDPVLTWNLVEIKGNRFFEELTEIQ